MSALEKLETRSVSAGEEAVTGTRRLLVAVDDSASAGRAVSYVADFLGGRSGYRILLFHVLSVPQEDLFPTAAERSSWVEKEETRARAVLARYREVLTESGFSENDVETALCRREEGSLVDDILQKQVEMGTCTVVIGRNSRSRNEDFLLGSVSSRIVREARHCSVWVVK